MQPTARAATPTASTSPRNREVVELVIGDTSMVAVYCAIKSESNPRTNSSTAWLHSDGEWIHGVLPGYAGTVGDPLLQPRVTWGYEPTW